jgi:uncharacterized protein (UPF0332 family)
MAHMDEKTLRNLLDDRQFLDKRIEFYKSSIFLNSSRHEVQGHLAKARHNLSFLSEIRPAYSDWMLVVCYYAAYHAALALILTRGYYSKNHDATLCLLIREFYKKELAREEIELLNMFDVEDLLFYAESKAKREEASYTTSTKFDSSLVSSIRLKTTLFVNKAEKIIVG